MTQKKIQEGGEREQGDHIEANQGREEEGLGEKPNDQKVKDIKKVLSQGVEVAEGVGVETGAQVDIHRGPDQNQLTLQIENAKDQSPKRAPKVNVHNHRYQKKTQAKNLE